MRYVTLIDLNQTNCIEGLRNEMKVQMKVAPATVTSVGPKRTAHPWIRSWRRLGHEDEPHCTGKFPMIDEDEFFEGLKAD